MTCMCEGPAGGIEHHHLSPTHRHPQLTWGQKQKEFNSTVHYRLVVITLRDFYFVLNRTEIWTLLQECLKVFPLLWFKGLNKNTYSSFLEPTPPRLHPNGQNSSEGNHHHFNTPLTETHSMTSCVCVCRKDNRREWDVKTNRPRDRQRPEETLDAESEKHMEQKRNGQEGLGGTGTGSGVDMCQEFNSVTFIQTKERSRWGRQGFNVRQFKVKERFESFVTLGGEKKNPTTFLTKRPIKSQYFTLANQKGLLMISDGWSLLIGQ